MVNLEETKDRRRPMRIQRKRTKGWKMPDNTVYVGRGSKWGNPYKVGKDGSRYECVVKFKDSAGMMLKQDAKKELAGKNLACWCKADEVCHADVLLTWAN